MRATESRTQLRGKRYMRMGKCHYGFRPNCSNEATGILNLSTSDNGSDSLSSLQ